MISCINLHIHAFSCSHLPARYLVCLRTARPCYEGIHCWPILQEKKGRSTAATSTVCSWTASNSASAQSKIKDITVTYIQ